PYPYGPDYDLRPVVRALVDEPPAVVAARFHATLAAMIVDAARRARLPTVALSGGCFQNRRLTETARRWLGRDGFEVLIHRRVPPNDGGVALGQAAVAAHRHARRQA